MPDVFPDEDPDRLCFDYSSPEAQEAIRKIMEKIMEVRDEHTGPLARKVALYERTLGLAVIPVLLRRVLIVLRRAATRD
jgi:hypothetical protein